MGQASGGAGTSREHGSGRADRRRRGHRAGRPRARRRRARRGPERPGTARSALAAAWGRQVERDRAAGDRADLRRGRRPRRRRGATAAYVAAGFGRARRRPRRRLPLVPAAASLDRAPVADRRRARQIRFRAWTWRRRSATGAPTRRSGRSPVPQAELDELFELARWAPNHHLTNPWRFRVLGPRALERLKEAAGPEAAPKLDRAPTLVVCSCVLSGDPVQDEEDLHATACAAYIVLLGAHARGPGRLLAHPRGAEDRRGPERGRARGRRAVREPDPPGRAGSRSGLRPRARRWPRRSPTSTRWTSDATHLAC